MAQDADPKIKGKTFRATLFNQWGGPDLYVKHKKSLVRIQPAKCSYTRPYRYRENVINFYKKTLSEEGEETYTVSLRVEVPPSVKEPLVILAWNNQTKQAVAKAIDFSPTNFRYGSYQIVNMSNFPIGGFIGKKTNTFICRPKQEYISSFEFAHQAATPIVIYSKIDGESQKVFGSITTHRKRKRSIYILYPERNKIDQIVYQSIVIVDHKKSE